MKRMRIFSISLLFLSAILMSSCEEMMDFGVSVETDYTHVDFVVEPTDEVGEAVFSTNVMDNTLDSLLDGTDIRRENITSIVLKEVIIELQNDDPEVTFDCFSRVEATIESNGLSEIVIAYLDSVPPGATSLSCDIKNTELLPYFEGTEYILRARGKSVSPIEDTLYIHGKLKFSVVNNAASELFE